MKYARIHNNQVVEIVDLDGNIESRIQNGDPVLRPLVYNTVPEYNKTTQTVRERYTVTSSTVLVEYDVVPAFTSVDTYKTVVIGMIDTWRDVALRNEVLAHGRYWQTDRRSKELLSDAITLATVGVPLPPVWRDATNDNMVVEDLSTLVVIAAAMAEATQAAYTRSWQLKEYVRSLPDAESTIGTLSQLTWETQPLN